MERKRRTETRLTPLGRFLVSLLWIVLTLIGGSIIGYSLIGQGDPLDVFQMETWIQLYKVIINSLL